MSISSRASGGSGRLEGERLAEQNERKEKVGPCRESWVELIDKTMLTAGMWSKPVRRYPRWGLILAAFLLMSTAHEARGGPPTEQLKGAIDRVIQILDDPTLKSPGKLGERRAAIRKVANEVFDFSETAKRALGRHWQKRTPQERDEFVKLFADLLEHAYISKIDVFGGPQTTKFGREQVEGDFAGVPTTITTKHGREISVNYRMLRQGDRWVVYDFIVEDVSLVSNYRVQFNKIIETASYEELLRRLKARQKEFTQEAAGG